MPDPITWYALGRDILDNQSISEAIDAKILAHNQDVSAHGQGAEAIYNHRIAEVLDHLDDSVLPQHISIDLTHIEQVQKTADQTISGDFVFHDVDDLVISITSGKIGRILLYTTVFATVSGNQSDPVIRFKVTKDGVDSYYPNVGGVNIFAAGAPATANTRAFSFFWSTDIPAGVVVIKLQAARSTTDETVQILGLQVSEHSSLGILSVGSYIT